MMARQADASTRAQDDGQTLEHSEQAAELTDGDGVDVGAGRDVADVAGDVRGLALGAHREHEFLELVQQLQSPGVFS